MYATASENREFSLWKASCPALFDRVEECLSERTSEKNGISHEMTHLVSLTRYFALMDMLRETLQGVFTREEISLILNANPSAWWPESSWCINNASHIKDALYWAYMSDGSEPQEISSLLNKLDGLSLAQVLALVDILECAWRNGLDSIPEVDD